MGIRESGYRHWDGEFTSHGMRWWSIAKQGVRVAVYTKARLFGVVLLALLVWVPYFFFGLYWLIERNAAETQGTLTQLQGGTDRLLRQQLYMLFQGWEVMVFPLFAAAIIAPLVSNDLRSNALYIYLSKPLRRIDYILGKSVAAAIWLAPVTFLPSLFVWLMAVATSTKTNKPKEALEILGEIMLVQVLAIVVVAGIMLALSSVTKRWWVAFASFIGGWYVLWILSEVLQGIRRDYRFPHEGREWLLASGVTNLIVVAREIYDQRPPAPPDWGVALLLCLALAGGGLAVFLWTILRLEVAE